MQKDIFLHSRNTFQCCTLTPSYCAKQSVFTRIHCRRKVSTAMICQGYVEIAQLCLCFKPNMVRPSERNVCYFKIIVVENMCHIYCLVEGIVSSRFVNSNVKQQSKTLTADILLVYSSLPILLFFEKLIILHNHFSQIYKICHSKSMGLYVIGGIIKFTSMGDDCVLSIKSQRRCMSCCYTIKQL